MKPLEIRNQNFESLLAVLDGQRATVRNAWMLHGPGTTREVSRRSQIDILTFRPRTTELYQAGLLVCVESGPRHEGVYRVRTAAEWEEWAAAQRGDRVARQLQFTEATDASAAPTT